MWVGMAGSESAEIKSRGKYALRSYSVGFILVCLVFTGHGGESKCCIWIFILFFSEL